MKDLSYEVVAKSSLGSVLRTARVRRGLSPEGLAALSGVSRNMIKTAENDGNISVRKLEKLVDALGLSEVPIRGATLTAAGVDEGNVGRALSIADRLAKDAAELVVSLRGGSSSRTPKPDPRQAPFDIVDYVRRLPTDEREKFRDYFLEEVAASFSDTGDGGPRSNVSDGAAPANPATRRRPSR